MCFVEKYRIIILYVVGLAHKRNLQYFESYNISLTAESLNFQVDYHNFQPDTTDTVWKEQNY